MTVTGDPQGLVIGCSSLHRTDAQPRLEPLRCRPARELRQL